MSQIFAKSDYAKAIADLGLSNKPNLTPKENTNVSEGSFLSHLREGIENVDRMQKAADKMAVSVSSGKTENLHETMLALSQAELGFNLMVQVRNKALESYQEIMRMPV